jgi:parvulin-like peptidyl-prolyl isomerase
VVSKLFCRFSALGAVFVAGAALAACGGVPGNAVVQVGDMPITKSAFDHWMKVAANSSQRSATGATQPIAVPVPPKYTACIAQLKGQAGKASTTDAQYKAQCAQEYQSLQSQVLQFLISADWVIGEAKAQKVSVPDSKVRNQFNTIKAQQFPTPAAYNAFIAQSGQSESDLLLRVKLDLLSTALRNKIEKGKGKLTPAQIAAYYNAHRSAYGKPATADVRIILTKTQAQAQAARAAIAKGTPFAAEAKKVSTDASAKQGGLLTGVTPGQQEQSLDKAIFAASPHQLGGPIQTPFGYYLFAVERLTPGTQQTLAQATPQITTQLAAQQQQQALTKFVSGFTKKWTKLTDCRSGYVVQDCKQYKAPKAAPRTSTAPGA